MGNNLVILGFFMLIACVASAEDGEKLSQEKANRIAAVTCAVMSETRNMDGAVRVREINIAREKIGEAPFLKGDYAIKEAIQFGLCEELVLNQNYDASLQYLKDVKRERARIAAEEQRIADSKPTVKEKFWSNGKLMSRTNYQSKNDGGEKHGLQEGYYENGQLAMKRNYKDGKRDGLFEFYYENGQLKEKENYKDGKEDGLLEKYSEDGRLLEKRCYDNGKKVRKSRCEE